MGKSPGKWIKRVLFGKKSSKSRTAKGEGEDSLKNRNDDEGSVRGPGTASDESSFMISDIVLVSNEGIGAIPIQGDEAVVAAMSQNGGSDESSNPEYLTEEDAAVKAQAAFRGYLARKAFHVLKGTIRLQALIRGHLVRRQAVATLHAMHAIVKFQALVRGGSVRRSSVDLQVAKAKFWQQKDGKPLDAWREKLSNNVFIYRLLSQTAVINPIRIEYDQGDSNSLFTWLERWTVTQFWKPISQTRTRKIAADPKSQPKSDRYATKTELAKSKRVVQRHQSATTESGQRNFPRRNARKFAATSPVDPERPQTELERVKHNLRKVSNLMTEASEQRAAEDNKVPSSISDIPGFVGDSVEKNVFTHRHSLPSSTNCKLNSQTPRAGKMMLTGNKGAIKSDKSLFSAREGTMAKYLLPIPMGVCSSGPSQNGASPSPTSRQ